MPAPKIAAWVANEALRHRRVPLGFGHIAIRESCEVCSETRVVARLCSLDELLHFECVQKSRGICLVLRCSPRTTQNASAGSDSERIWSLLMTDQPLS